MRMSEHTRNKVATIKYRLKVTTQFRDKIGWEYRGSQCFGRGCFRCENEYCEPLLRADLEKLRRIYGDEVDEIEPASYAGKDI